MNETTSVITKQDDDEIDLLELLNTILNAKWLILFFIFTATILAFIYAFGKTPIYRADALLQVESQKAAIPGLEDLTGPGRDDASVGTELQIIKSRKILGQAVDDLKLDISVHPIQIPLLGNLYRRFLSFNELQPSPPVSDSIDELVRQYAWSDVSIAVNSLEVPPNLINKQLILTSRENDSFDLAYKNQILLEGKVNEPAISQDSKIKIYILALKAVSGTKFSLIKSSKLRTIEDLKKQIQASEKGKKTGIINLAFEGEDRQRIMKTLDHISKTYLQQNKSRSSEEASHALKFLQEQIKPVKEKVEIAGARLKTYRTSNQTANMLMETQAVLNVVSGIDTELQKLSLQRDILSQRYMPNHPTIQAISPQENKLRQRKKRTLSKISKLPKTQQQLLKLEGDYRVAYTVYIDLLNNIQEFKIAKASDIGNVYIVDTAVVHDKAVKPKKTLILALGALLGGILGTLIVFIRKALHSTVNNPEKLEETTGIPVYATVPLTQQVKLTGGLKKNKRQKSLLALEKTDDPAIESVRSLRTSLHFALLEAKNNIVMITGPAPGIGKSFISSNFAAVIAAGEQNVLLIDADMRKGYLHNLLNKKVSPGLSDLISDNATFKDSIHTIQMAETPLDIITRGQTPPNPSELLMHSNFEKLLNQLSKQYDLIIIDTPPVHAVTDPTIIGKHCGVVFMVVRSDQHDMKEIEYAVRRLAHTGINTKGFIFNGYVAKKSGYGYHSYYGDYKSDT